MVVAGLNAQNFSPKHWVHGGHQGLFEEDNFTSPAVTARLDWVGVHGLRLGASAYYCSNTMDNAYMSEESRSKLRRIPVFLWSFDAQWLNKYVEARANVLSGNVDNADALGGLGGKRFFLAKAH